MQDGVIEEYEYGEVEIKDSWISIAVADDANDPLALNLKPKLYITYDDTNVYLAGVYTPAVFSQTHGDDPASMWNDNAIQWNLSEVGKVDTDRLEFGTALTSDTGALISNVWADYLTSGWTAEGSYIVVNNGGTITHEVKVPWTAFSSTALKEGGQFGLCVVYSTGADSGNHIHTQIASGCTGNSSKQAGNFAKVQLGAQIVVPVVEEVVETPADSVASTPDAATPSVTAPAAPSVAAPQTGDATLVFAVIAIIALAGAVVTAKKRKV
jgi:LPXTG-motif cell wall-anchored protein